ncbi:granulocyte-macrophage colony-stimulating factor receptor subunit alpha-like, partial [Cavia porcellus]|uniref:granulocyte-macrophage colony-stimulating factor receptor subunit alpha-like n=1 Tax=Cavia porcellus TaxID=10141 RepID=UPI002FE34A80
APAVHSLVASVSAAQHHHASALSPRPSVPRTRPCGSPGCIPRAVLLLLLLCLGPAVLLTGEQLGRDPALGLNVTFDPKSWTLSWNCPENATNFRCKIIPKNADVIELKPRGRACTCTLKYFPLHRGVTFEVHATVQGRPVREELQYPNPGLNRTAADTFSCFIYDASYLNCSWARGPAAPRDAQYFLFITNTRTRRQQECPLYSPAAGTHTGCHLRDRSLLGFENYFLLTGTSAGTPIQFYDAIFNVKEIERMSPPTNVTVHCNESHCCVGWKRPQTWTSLSHRDFQYQLDIQRSNAGPGSRNPPVDVAGQADNQYSIPSPQPRARHTVQIRVRDVRSGPWSSWSQPVEFGSDTWQPRALSLYIPVVLGTVMCALVLGFLFKRFFSAHGLCPRIPHVKDKLNSVDGVAAQVPWEDMVPSARKASPEDVLVVQEVS